MRAKTARVWRRGVPFLLLGAAALPLAACSSIPDRLNPTTWFGSSDKQASAAARPGGPASRTIDSSQPYPNLSSVPEPPKPTLDPAQRMAMMRGLEGDRQGAREQDAALRRAVPAPAGSGQGALVRAVPQVPDAGSSAASPADAVTSAPVTSGPAMSPPTMSPPAMSLPATSALAPLPAEVAPTAPAAALPPTAALPAAPPPSRYPAEPPPGRAGAASAPSAGPATQAGVRYAIPPRPPVSPPEPLSIQQSGVRSSELGRAAPVQLAAADAFFAVASDADAPVLYASESWVAGSSVAASSRAVEHTPAVSAQVAVLTFANGASQLSAAQRAQLRQVVAMHERHGGRLWVLGHASHRTPDMAFTRHMLANYGVSVDRAHQVADALRRLGVPERTLAVSARSDWDPVYFEVMPAGEAENRRVEIYLEY